MSPATNMMKPRRRRTLGARDDGATRTRTRPKTTRKAATRQSPRGVWMDRATVRRSCGATTPNKPIAVMNRPTSRATNSIPRDRNRLQQRVGHPARTDHRHPGPRSGPDRDAQLLPCVIQSLLHPQRADSLCVLARVLVKDSDASELELLVQGNGCRIGQGDARQRAM